MIKALMVAAVVTCVGTVALAGPNAGGTLIIVTDGTAYCADDGPFCGSNVLDNCEDGIIRMDGVNSTPIVLNVMAAFDPGASPRLAGVTFGVDYSEFDIFVAGHGSCGDFELSDDSWPGSGTGTAVTWNDAQTASINDVYWFAAYNYYGFPFRLSLTSHPSQGSNFADDAVPPALDPIAALGSFGFDTSGEEACPEAGDLPAACCAADGSCTIVLEAECDGDFLPGEAACQPNPCPQPSVGACCASDASCSTRTRVECDDAGGVYQGDDVACDPNPCEPNPTVESTWGEIKNEFR